MNIQRFLLYLFANLSISSLFSMETPPKNILESLIPLTIEKYHHILPLKDVLQHITTYQKVCHNGIDKISGFHYYGHLNPQIESVLDGTLIKINNRFWIFTYDTIKQFHTGYIIYQGKVYSQPKSFFPYSWSREAVALYIQELAQEGVCESKQIPEAEHTYSLILKPSLINSQHIPLKVILHASSPLHILTIHPLIKETKRMLSGTLETLATWQKALYRIPKSSNPEITSKLLETLSIATCSLFSVIDLLEQSDIHVKNEKDQTPLMLAARLGRCDLINVLLEQEAPLGIQDILGNTALHYAIDSGVYEAVLGLAHPIVLNKANNQGETPLIRALQRKHYDCAELLLYLGAEVNTPDIHGYTPLMYAVKHHTLTKKEAQACIAFIEAWLKKGGTLNAQDKDGSTALMHAITCHNSVVARYLLHNQADYITIKNQRGESGYTLAGRFNLQEIVFLIDQKEKEKKTLAEQKEQQRKQREFLQTIKEEILKGTLSSSSLKTLPSLEQEILNKIFLFAVKENKSKVVEQLLVKFKAIITPEVYKEALTLAFTKDINIFSTLIQNVSIKKELVEEWFLRLLVAHYKEQRGNYTTLLAFVSTNYPFALTRALQNEEQHRYLLSFIEQRVVSFSHVQAGEFLLEAIRYKAISLVEKLFDVYPSVLSYKNTKGQNALMIAAIADHPSLIALLYRKGLKLDEQDSFGKIALSYASSESNALKELQALSAQEEREKQEKQKVTRLQERNREIEILKSLNYSALMIAAYYNDTEIIEKDRITNVNSTDCKGATAVMVAAERNNLEALNALLSKLDLAINAQDRKGMTPLMYAVKNNNTSCVERLLSQQASIFIFNQENNNVFMLTKNISSNTLKLLETYGTKELITLLEPVLLALEDCIPLLFDELDKKVRFSLLPCRLKADIFGFLIQKNAPQALKYFLQKAASPLEELMKHMSFNPISYAADNYCKETLNILLNYAALAGKEVLEVRLKDFPEELIFLIPENFSTFVALFRKFAQQHLHEPSTNVCCPCHKSVGPVLELSSDIENLIPLISLTYAARRYEDMKKLITVIKPNLDTIIVKPVHNTSLLIHAVATAIDRSVIRFLLDYTTNINQTDINGTSALFFACNQAKPDQELVQLLIDRGADIIIQDKHGLTPLSAAINQGHIEIAKILLESEASINRKDSSKLSTLPFGRGQALVTPLIAACKTGNKEMVKLLLEYQADVNQTDKNGQTALTWACSMKHQEIVQLLFNHQAQVNSQDCNGQTALMVASNVGSLALVKLLLKYKADVNTQASNGETALHTCIANKTPETVSIVKLLLEHKADPNKADSIGRTPLLWAAQNNCVETAILLLNDNAAVNHQDQDGATALHYACKSGHKEVVKVLLAHRANVNIPTYTQRVTPLIAACSVETVLIARDEKEETEHVVRQFASDINKSKPNKKEIIEMLLAVSELDLSYEMAPGYTILKLAEFWRNKEAIKLIKARLRKDTLQQKK